jgi:hypothetical protein
MRTFDMVFISPLVGLPKNQVQALLYEIYNLQLYSSNTPVLLARIFHESLAATADMAVLPGVLGCRTLRRTVQVRLGSNPLRFPGGTAIFTVSPQQFMKYPDRR